LSEQIAHLREAVTRLEANTGQIPQIQQQMARLEAEKDSLIKSGLFLPPDKALDLYNEIMSYRTTISSIDNIKYYLAPIVLISLTIVSALAIYFVGAKINDLRVESNKDLLNTQQQIRSELREAIHGRTSALRQDIKDRIDEARNDLHKPRQDHEQSIEKIDEFQSESLQRITELQNESIRITEDFQNEVIRRISEFQGEVETTIQTKIGAVTRDNEIKLQQILIRVNYAIALSFWQNHAFETAIYYAQQAIDNIDSILSFVSGDERDNFLRRKYIATGDLAYYYAENYCEKQNANDAQMALTLARSLPSIFDTVDGQRQIMIINNHIFVIAHVRPITENDKQIWRRTFENYRETIKLALEATPTVTQPDSRARFARYERFWESLVRRDRFPRDDDFSGV
jgi:hypothetical protein